MQTQSPNSSSQAMAGELDVQPRPPSFGCGERMISIAPFLRDFIGAPVEAEGTEHSTPVIPLAAGALLEKPPLRMDSHHHTYKTRTLHHFKLNGKT